MWDAPLVADGVDGLAEEVAQFTLSAHRDACGASADGAICLNKLNQFQLATRCIGDGAVDVNFGMPSGHLLRKRCALANSMDFL